MVDVLLFIQISC